MIHRAGQFRLTVLNPGGRDRAHSFSEGAGSPNDSGHAPVNFHGYAASTGGVFHRETKAAVAEGLPVLLLLRGDFRATRDALRELHRAGLTTAVSFKETGLHQIARQLSDPKRAALFHEIIRDANGFLAATPEAVIFGREGKFIPTPYPITDSRWDFSRPLGERRGIFIGTREWDVPSRNHLTAFQLALGLDQPVTAFDENPRRCRKLWSSLGGDDNLLRLLSKRLPYRDYLAEIAAHRLVLQADKSAVPGQVAGDALLCRLPCLGGDGATERLAFPRTSGFGRSLGELGELAAKTLHDSRFYADVIAESQQLAGERLSFEAVAPQLAEFFAALVR
ncbi:MAG TPA: hypothetical protein VGI85_05560 [Chthoniobacterales bacterium]|jgi:hypothetical protein